MFLCHLLLVIIAFKDFRIHPDEVIFNGYGDGLKNYFTLLAYVKEPALPESFLKFRFFNYPFGEYIYTADNTPFFAVPFKWFCLHITDISDYTLVCYNIFVVLNIIFCGLLCYAVLKRITGPNLFSFFLSIILPWTNMQVIRIWRGHFNLSFSSLILLAVLLGILWHEQKKNPKRQMAAGAGMVLLIYGSFLIHGYYLPIIGIFQAAMLFFLGVYKIKSPEGRKSLAASVLVPVLATGISVFTLIWTDGYYSMRPTAAGGYDWMEHKVRFWSLFSAYDFHFLRFPFKSLKGNYDPENMGYLGNTGLYALLGFIILGILSRHYRIQITEIQKNFFRNPLTASVFWASLLLLIINFGEHYYTEDLNGGFLFYNFLNPLYLLHQFTDAVEQFRSLGRFAWAFFWGFNIWMFYLLVKIYPQFTKGLKITVIAGMVFLGSMEVKDYVDAMQGKASRENFLSRKNFPEFEKLNIRFGAYQAVLGLPYYNVGSEKREIILDDYEPLSVFSYQLALYSGLPLINVKLSRTVPEQALMLENLVANDSLSPELRQKFSEKPVLVFLHKDAPGNPSLPSVPGEDRPAAREIYWKSLELPRRLNLQPVDSLGDYVFYEWELMGGKR